MNDFNAQHSQSRSCSPQSLRPNSLVQLKSPIRACCPALGNLNSNSGSSPRHPPVHIPAHPSACSTLCRFGSRLSGAGCRLCRRNDSIMLLSQSVQILMLQHVLKALPVSCAIQGLKALWQLEQRLLHPPPARKKRTIRIRIRVTEHRSCHNVTYLPAIARLMSCSTITGWAT
jgi:hypothetical protein